MDTQEIQRDIRNLKQTITTLKDTLVIRRERLARAQTQLADAIAAESKELELKHGDYGKVIATTWVFVGEKVYWEDGAISEYPYEKGLIDSRKGNIFREMEERQE